MAVLLCLYLVNFKINFNCTPRPPGLRVSEEGRMYGSLESVYNCTPRPPGLQVDCPCLIAPHDPPGVYDCDPQVKQSDWNYSRLKLRRLELLTWDWTPFPGFNFAVSIAPRDPQVYVYLRRVEYMEDCPV